MELKKMGYDVGKIDGKIGDTLRLAISRLSRAQRPPTRRLCQSGAVQSG